MSNPCSNGIGSECFKVSSMWIWGDQNIYPIATHIITQSGGPVWWRQIQACNVRSLRCRQTWMRSSWCCTQNRDSSENTTSRHTWCTFVIKHFVEDSSVCGAKSRVAEAMIPEQRVHATAKVTEVFMQTHFVLQTVSFLESWLFLLPFQTSEVAARSVKAIWVKRLSCRLLMIVCHWDPARRSG